MNETQSQLQEELDRLKRDQFLDPKYQRRKRLMWGIRNTIMVVLYIIFWDVNWVPWTLIGTIPLSLFSLAAIIIGPRMVQQKVQRAQRAIDGMEEEIEEKG